VDPAGRRPRPLQATSVRRGRTFYLPAVGKPSTGRSRGRKLLKRDTVGRLGPDTGGPRAPATSTTSGRGEHRSWFVRGGLTSRPRWQDEADAQRLRVAVESRLPGQLNGQSTHPGNERSRQFAPIGRSWPPGATPGGEIMAWPAGPERARAGLCERQGASGGTDLSVWISLAQGRAVGRLVVFAGQWPGRLLWRSTSPRPPRLGDDAR